MICDSTENTNSNQAVMDTTNAPAIRYRRPELDGEVIKLGTLEVHRDGR